jgi:hypothetical protein
MKVNLAPGLINEGSNYTTRVAQRIDLDDAISFTTGVTTVANTYSIQRDAAGPDFLQLNVPSGLGFRFSIAADVELSWTTGAFAFQQATTLSTTEGVLTIDGDDGITLQTTGSGNVTVAEILSVSGAVDIQGGYADGGGAPYDGVVDAGGGGNWTTLQDGDDALDAAINTTMLVKSGTYSTLTVSTNNVKIVCEPGTIATGAIVLSGDNITLMLGAGCDIRGLITLSGANWSVICENGVDMVGVQVDAGGDFGYFNGGGWDTLIDGGTTRTALDCSGEGCTFEDFSVQTTAGQGNSYQAILFKDGKNTARHIRIPQCDYIAIAINNNFEECVVEGCLILQSDSQGMYIGGPRTRIINNGFMDVAAGSEFGLQFAATADDSVCVGNIIQVAGSGVPVDIQTDCENVLAIGNRADGVVTDGSGTSTVGTDLNDETAF